MKDEILKNKIIFDAIYKGQKEIPNVFYEPVLDLIINIIIKENYSKILDYGCGDGRFGFYFKQRIKNKKLIGVDISNEALEICSGLYDEVYLTDGLSLPDMRFDFIFLSSVLEHISVINWDSIFAEISLKLEKRGSIFIVVPNKNSPMRKFSKQWDGEEEKYGHVSITDIGFLKNKLRQFGFNNLKFSFLFVTRKIPAYKIFPKFLRPLIMIFYPFLNIYPFYYLRDSFWVLVKKKVKQ